MSQYSEKNLKSERKQDTSNIPYEQNRLGETVDETDNKKQDENPAPEAQEQDEFVPHPWNNKNPAGGTDIEFQEQYDAESEPIIPKRIISLETFVFLALFLLLFGYLGHAMGVDNMFNTLMNTAHYLLIDVCFFIMAIAVLAGAISALFSEFGVVALMNKLISKIMRPIYGLPGAASLGILTTYLSDNPAIISLANDKGFKKFFKNYELPTLCNLGTAFGMGFILTSYMIGLGKGTEYIGAALVGNLGAFIGSVVSVRLMRRHSKKFFGIKKGQKEVEKEEADMNLRLVRDGSVFERALDSILEGGKSGVDMGLTIIPGVLVICTMVMMLTFGPESYTETGVAVYTGAPKEGIAFFPMVGEFLSPVLQPLFGFNSPEAISFPITSLGSVGAAMGLLRGFVTKGILTANDIAVFTAMGMCWSGYLSTHVGMMDALKVRKLTSKAILSHTVGGLVAGISAHMICLLFGIS